MIQGLDCFGYEVKRVFSLVFKEDLLAVSIENFRWAFSLDTVIDIGKSILKINQPTCLPLYSSQVLVFPQYEYLVSYGIQ